MDSKRIPDTGWDKDRIKMRTYLVRYSEIGLKSKKTRNVMETRLITNATKMIERNNKKSTVTRERGRIYFFSKDDISNELERIMGIKTFSEVIGIEFSELEEILSKGKKLYKDVVSDKTFAVYSRRQGSHNFSSMDIDRLLGDILQPFSAGVDLKHPQVKIELEIRENHCYFSLDRKNGPGGLPIETEGKLISLISGGIDSPVSTWMMLKRGSPVDMIFVSLAPPLDVREFLTKAKILYDQWYAGYNPRIFIVDATRLIEDYLYAGKMKYANVSYKKMLYNIGEKLAELSNSNGIITGESSGQVSSQTPENLFQLSTGMKYPVIRPLIGMDKDWISDFARKIGTFNNDSSDEFCALFSEKPITRIKREELVEDLERLKSYDPIREEIVEIKGTEIDSYLDSIGKDNARIRKPEEMPEGSLIIDVRDRLSYKAWHPENALNITYRTLNGIMDQIDKQKPIVFFCKKGLQSANYAGKMRKLGYQAFYTDENVVRSQSIHQNP